ncbi:MAG: FIST C-terminal domain-containing protein [Kangiellaceae bacterium]|nr:FIST C-terminal domain-containing protein [Kangiellaceae bacterium]
MRISQYICAVGDGWSPALPTLDTEAQLLLCFGSERLFTSENTQNHLKTAFPNAQIAGCTTAGEIFGTRVSNEQLVVTTVEFAHSHVQIQHVDIEPEQNSFNVGQKLAQKLAREQLKHVFVISDGLKINGTALVQGMSSKLGNEINITGGLAADGSRFKQTWVWHGDKHSSSIVVAVGLYGDKLQVSYGSFGGWDAFGPEREISRSQDNVLYELDGQPALWLYKKYLGQHAENLPSSALLFPLGISRPNSDELLVRTVLSVNEADGSMTFAGDIPQGAKVRLMKANPDRLIDGAQQAANLSKHEQSKLAICVSCVGRKMVMHQRVEEEIEIIKEVLGEDCQIAGFYSYGEICPHGEEHEVLLHNQTMTITTLHEDH